jgi:hypothetical protein
MPDDEHRRNGSRMDSENAMQDGPVVGAQSASELLRAGVPRKHVILSLRDVLDLTEEEAEAAISAADAQHAAPPPGNRS